MQIWVVGKQLEGNSECESIIWRDHDDGKDGKDGPYPVCVSQAVER